MQEMQESQFWTLGQEDRLEEGMAIHSSILAWKVPWTEEPGGLQYMGWQGVGCDRKHSQMTYLGQWKIPGAGYVLLEMELSFPYVIWDKDVGPEIEAATLS